MIKPRKIIWLITLVVFVVLLEGSARRADASPQNQDQGQQQGSFAVGHATRILDVKGTRCDVTGTRCDTRPVNVHLWYPAPDNCQSGDGNSQGCPPSVYTSRLNGIPLLPQWDPLSWTIGSTQAFEELPVSSAQSSYPVIIFSHGNQNNAIDYVYTLEALASYGFIVAAPDHVNNTQDDVRIDFINGQAASTVIPCFDGLPSPCAHADLAESMTDRVRDVSAIIDALPTWFGSRANTSRVGVMGHSRGTVTALAAAGGSTAWVTPGNPQGFSPVPGVKAVMGLANGAQNVTSGVDLPKVKVPTQLVAGSLDPTLCVSQQLVGPTSCVNPQLALPTLGSTDKGLVTIQKAKHRHFDSGMCAQTQSSGAIAQANPARAILDFQTVTDLLLNPSHPTLGVSMDFCGFDTFTNPTDIRNLVATLTVTTTLPAGFNVTQDNVPTTGLTSDTVKDDVIQLAVAFFTCAFTQTNASCSATQ